MSGCWQHVQLMFHARYDLLGVALMTACTLLCLDLPRMVMHLQQHGGSVI